MFSRIAMAGVALLATQASGAPLRYKLEVTSTQQMDMTSMGQGLMNVTLHSTSWISLSMADSAGGSTVHVVVDSSTVDLGDAPPAGMDPSMLAIAKGATFDFFYNGEKALPPDPATIAQSPGLGLVMGGALSLFPRVRANAKSGDHWTDSTTTDTTMAFGQGKSTTIANWTAGSMDGEALILDAATTGQVALTGSMGTISGNSTGTMHVCFVPKMPARCATTESTNNMSLAISAAPDPLSMVVTLSMKATRLP